MNQLFEELKRRNVVRVDATEDHARRYDEAGIVMAQAILDRGLTSWLAGNRDEVLRLMAEAVEEGAILLLNRDYLQDLYDEAAFAPIHARFLERRAEEQADFLSSACPDSPWADVWTPAAGTCDGSR